MQIAAGTLIGALAVNLFMVPIQLPAGGLSGLMLILHYIWGLPIGPLYMVANLPALFWLYRLIGWSAALRTLAGIALFSLFIELTAPASAHAPTTNPMLATVYAGVVMGFGLGLVLRAGGSTGGTSAIARVVRHYTGMDMARFLMLTDVVILGFGALFLSLEAILYGLIMTFLLMKVIQVVQEGFRSSRCVLIVTESVPAVTTAITGELQRGVTVLQGSGGYTGHSRPVLLCVVTEEELHRLKRRLSEVDPEAFIIVTDAREVAGRGFTLETEVRRIPFWAGQSGD